MSTSTLPPAQTLPKLPAHAYRLDVPLNKLPREPHNSFPTGESRDPESSSASPAYPESGPWKARSAIQITQRDVHWASRRGITVNRIVFTVLVIIGVRVLGAPRIIAQDTSSQSSAATDNADAIPDREITLLRHDTMSPR